MLEPSHNDELPPIPGKRYFTIGEVSDLCSVKPHVLRYWEQEFPQLKPVKRRGNDQGFTIGGARQRLTSDDSKEDTNQTQQMIRQMISELEDVLGALKS